MNWIDKLKSAWPGHTPAFNDEQTSRVVQLRQEVALHPSRGLTPQRLARILQRAEQGDIIAQCDLFDDMEEKDTQIFSELSKRRRSVMGLDWQLLPPRDASASEKRQTQALDSLMRDTLDMEKVLFDLTDAIGKGFSALEIEWAPAHNGQRLIRALNHRPQRWFTVPPDNRNDLRLRQPGHANGEPLWPLGWVVHRHAATNGWLPREALFRVLAWPYLFKQYSIRDLAEFLEIYGLPLRLGKYPRGATSKEKATLLRAVMAIGHSAGGIIPDGMSIDFQNAAAGQADPFKAMTEWAEASVSKAIVGQTLTATSGNNGAGSRALGEVHDKVRWDITVSDARQLNGTLTQQLVLPLGLLNGLIADTDRAPRFAFNTTEIEDIKDFSEALPQLVGVGMRIPVSWAHEKLGIPLADNDNDVLALSAQPAAHSALKGNVAALSSPLSGDQNTPDPDTPAALIADQLGDVTQSSIADWLATVTDILNAATSLEEARAMMLDAFDELDTNPLAAQLADALVSAGAAGRFDVESGSGD